MTYASNIRLALLVLFAGIVPLQAGSLKNPGFEEHGGWQVVTRGSRLQSAFSDDTAQTGQKSFTVSLAWESPTKKEDFAGIVQVVELTHADKGISFSVKDSYTGNTSRYHWMELLLDGEVIWEADVAGGDTDWRKVSLDLTRYLKEVKRKRVGRNKYREEKTYELTFRVFERNGTIGHSLGGHNAMFLAAFDDRVKIAVSSCGWTPFEYYETQPGRLKTWALPKYMPPLETLYKSDHRQFPFDFHEVAAAIAPRVFFSSSPTNDGVFPGWGPKAAASPIRDFFKAHGAENAFQFHQPRAQHRFPWDTRQAAYRSMNHTFDYHFHGELGLLAERRGEKAIPILKKALVDANPKVRWAAADMLGTLNDASGRKQMTQDLKTFSTDRKHLEHALEVARVLAELGDISGYELAADLAVDGTTPGQRWRAAVVLAHLANADKITLQAAGMDPIAALKTMAAEEKHEGVFFVFVDQVHKILKDRTDMIDIFAIAKESTHHSEAPPGNRFRMAEIFHSVAVRDKDKTWR